MHNPFTADVPLSVNLNLGVQLLMGITLLVGAALARRRHYRAHKYCQASVVLLNLVPIGLVMLPAFHLYVQPGIPSDLGAPYYAVASAHAVVAAAGEVLALYVIAVAGTTLLPLQLRFSRFKLWMRTTLALWWVAILLGIATYVVWHLQTS